MAKYCLIAGHGAGDSGAVGNNLREDTTCRDLVYRLSDFLTKGGVENYVFDTNKNCFEETKKGLGVQSIPQGYEILEFHLNASTNAQANGCEVLIANGLNADDLDYNILNVLSKYFTKRSIKNQDLLNADIARNQGKSYRLVETFFVSSPNDVNIYNQYSNEIIRDLAICLGANFQQNEEKRSDKVVNYFGKNQEEYAIGILTVPTAIRRNIDDVEQRILPIGAKVLFNTQGVETASGEHYPILMYDNGNGWTHRITGGYLTVKPLKDGQTIKPLNEYGFVAIACTEPVLFNFYDQIGVK